MAEYTKNLNLKKPAPDDFVDVADLNGNFDTIDAEIKKAQDGSKQYYGICSTSTATAAKVVTVEGDFELKTGVAIDVKFSYANSAAAPTLNVNGTGAKSIKKYGSTAPNTYQWYANSIVNFVYSGTYWIMQNGTTATTTYYGITKLNSSTSSTSTTEAATPSAVKTAMDKANSAENKANAALPLNGGTVQVENTQTIFEEGRTIVRGSNGQIDIVPYDGDLPVGTTTDTYIEVKSEDNDKPVRIESSIEGNYVKGINTPIDLTDAANKQYVDQRTSLYLPLTGGTITGDINIPTGYTSSNDTTAANKRWVKKSVPSFANTNIKDYDTTLSFNVNGQNYTHDTSCGYITARFQSLMEDTSYFLDIISLNKHNDLVFTNDNPVFTREIFECSMIINIETDHQVNLFINSNPLSFFNLSIQGIGSTEIVYGLPCFESRTYSTLSLKIPFLICGSMSGKITSITLR